MQKVYVSTNDAPAAVGPYSQGNSFGDFVFTSGQLPIDPATGKFVEGDIKAHTRQVIKNVEAVLTAGGSSLAKVVKATVFLTDLNDFAAMNEVYNEFFGDFLPARTCFQVCKLPLGAAVEIEAIGHK